MELPRLLCAVVCAALVPRGVLGYVKTVEKEALLTLYSVTGGQNWALDADAPDDDMLQPGGNYYWDEAADPCPLNFTEAWHGVACVDPCYYPIDGDECRFGRITGLQLQHNGLVGTIPNDLFDHLINLTIVDLSFNEISGTIPTQIGKLRNVQIFQMSHNSLSGTIPTEIRTMGSHIGPDEMAMNLEDVPAEALVNPGYDNNATYPLGEGSATMGLAQFDVSHNFLNGTIPTTIGELINLQAVDVSDNADLGADGCCDNTDEYFNSFYGYNTTIPTEIGMLKKLQVLKMDWARFMRHIPTEIGNLRSLQFWRVKGSFTTNQVSGTIPTEVGRLYNLVEFMMENNTLSGTIPPELGDLTKLEMYSVQDNKLSGTIPDLFESLTQLTLWDTFNNKLSGDLPESVGNLSNLDYLYLQNEHLAALLNYYCKQRIDNSAVGRKYNYQVLANEYFNYQHVSVCANPYDHSHAFDALTGDY